MSPNFAYSNEMKTKLIKLIMEQVLKVRKDKASGALKYLQLNKLSKDVGARAVFKLVQAAASCSIENFSFIVYSARALFVNKTLTTVSNP